VQVTPTAIDNIGWRTFIIFACFCFAWVSYITALGVENNILTPCRSQWSISSFPETKGLELEDVDHLFERGGITGGVFTSRGYPVRPGFHRTQNTNRIEKPIEEHIEYGFNV
jgi:hypothetical protein